MKDEFITIDMYHTFRVNEIIGFISIGGDNGDLSNKICTGEYHSCIQFYFKNGTNIIVDFGDDKDCNDWRDAYMIYLKEIFTPSRQIIIDRVNEIIVEQNPTDYKQKRNNK